MSPRTPPRFMRMLRDRDDDLRRRFQKALENRYRLKSELGRGSMGVVYLAHDPTLDRLVALKLLPPEVTNRDMGARFLREARIVARLSHPNIVPIYSVEHAAEFLFFTMAYVDGETLGDRIRREKRLPVSEVCRIVRDVARAVGYAHSRRVIHRDLKPDNILLERHTDHVLVTDFGVAHLRQPGRQMPHGEFVGTAAYMSPEQARFEPADERSDIYALGVVAHHAATGSVPFRGTLAQVVDQQRNVEAPPLLVYGTNRDQTLAHCVAICLEKDPARRFQTMPELVTALEQSAELRHSIPVLVRRFVRRVTETGTAAVVGLVILGVGPLGGFLLNLSNGHWAKALLFGAAFGATVCAPVVALLPVVRRAVRGGHAWNDLVHALSVDYGQQEEEASHTDSPYVKKLGVAATAAKRTVWIGVGVFAAGFLMLVSGVDLPESLAMGVTSYGAFTALAAGLVSGVLNDKSDEVVAGWWLRFWSSRLGEWAVKVASLGLGGGRGSPWDRQLVAQEPMVMTDEQAASIWQWADEREGA